MTQPAEEDPITFASPLFTTPSGESLLLSNRGSSVGGSSTTSLNTTATDDFMSTVENVEDLVMFDEDTISARAQKLSIPEVEEEENDKQMPPATIEAPETEAPTPVISPNGSDSEADSTNNLSYKKMPPTTIKVAKTAGLSPAPGISLREAVSPKAQSQSDNDMKMPPETIKVPKTEAPFPAPDISLREVVSPRTKTEFLHPGADILSPRSIKVPTPEAPFPSPDISLREAVTPKTKTRTIKVTENDTLTSLVSEPRSTTMANNESSNPDAAGNVYKGAKGVWAWGKSVPVFSPFMGIAEAVAGTALGVAGTNLQDLDSNLIEPQLQNLDSGILNPVIKTVAGIMLGAAGTAEGIVKPIIIIVLSPFKMLTQQPQEPSDEQIEAMN
ncbi:MAG: hypothetical protein SGBAC_011764 [Bacillariaceae sp.]